ncbi:TolC family protein [Noviherbaspirillum pedocola]|uniref:TolC family protein n=1 Tax=Noviherbaspirillum pedocola TaxID=2801341 RepID=A0A934W7H1_9BURK|nr:TolC family protein [Noviherbaspirillum pedocola]MBK4734679.1 TolC family protein [Noviherbaspirillum pedocola]
MNSHSLSSPELREFIQARHLKPESPWPPLRWNLDSLTLAAFFFSPDLEAARSKLRTTEGSQITAAQRPNPVLQFPLQWTMNPNAGESPWIVGFALDIPIETAGKRNYRVNEAAHLVTAARLQVANVAWGIRSQLREQLLILWSTSERAGLLQQQVELDQKLVSMLEKRLAAGYASTWEVNQQRLSLIQDRNALLPVQQEMAATKVRVATVLGLRAQALDGAELDLSGFGEPIPELPPQEIRLQALLNRADVLESLAQYEASQAALQLEVARQYPNLHLGPGYTFDQGARKLGFDFTGLELPVFNRNQGPIAEARGRRLEAEARVKKIEAKAFADADGAVAAYDTARGMVLQNEHQLAVQGRQLSFAQRALELGQDDRLALVLAQKAELAARLAMLDATFHVQQAVGKIEDAMQRPVSGVPLSFRPNELAK